MNVSAPLVNQQVIDSTWERACPVQISVASVANLWKSIHSPSSGRKAMTKLPKKDNQDCKSYYTEKPRSHLWKKKRYFLPAQEKNLNTEGTKRSV